MTKPSSVPHVCLVNCMHPPNDVRVVEKIGRTLRQAGVEVSWIGPEDSKRMPKNDYGIRYHFYPPARSRVGRLLHNHRAALRVGYGLPRADVYIGVEPDSASVANRLAKAKHARAVFDVHEMYGDEMLHHWSPLGTQRVVKSLVTHGLRRVCRGSDLVMGVNDAVLGPAVGGSTPTMVVRNCAPSSFADGPPANVFPSSRPKTLTAVQGKSTKQHGSIIVVQAFGLAARRCSGLRVVFFDAFDADKSGLTRAEFDRVVTESGATDIVDVRSQIPMTQMPNVLRECDVGLITYDRVLATNSLPNKLFEFMAVGLPVIAPSYGREIRAIVDREQCGLLVDCERPEAIAEAIEYLHGHPDEGRAMGERGRKAFLARHNFEVELSPLLSLIRDWAADANASTA